MAKTDAVSGQNPDPDLAPSVRLLDIVFVCGMKIASRVTVTLEVGGKRVVEEQDELGNGPIKAAVQAIKRLVPHACDFAKLDISTEGEGEGANGVVVVSVRHQGQTYQGRCTHNNILIGAITAYIEVINRIRRFDWDASHPNANLCSKRPW